MHAVEAMKPISVPYAHLEHHNWRIADITGDPGDSLYIGMYRETDLTSKMHTHEFIQLYYIRRGKVLHEIAGQRTTLLQGDVFLIPPGVKHLLQAIPGAELEYCSLGFMPDFIGLIGADTCDFMNTFLGFVMAERVLSEHSVRPRLSFSGETLTRLEQAIAGMLYEYEHKEPGYREYLKGQLFSLLALIAREYVRSPHYEANAIRLNAYSDAILDSIEFVTQNFYQNIKIEDVSKKFFLSRTYFCSLFKQYTGSTLNKYVNDLRIKHAKKLLRTTEAPITEIAFSCGYAGSPNFCKKFKAETGVSPGEYRHADHRLMNR